ncbi:MAG: sigma-70 family RNA polymerase sigma factor [Acidobacteriota bacterium]|nr:sigma-70 family RNA polymerase sigma factor [Acidobacteriota bacterium]MDH3524929.1 sigma-70 family RNA polymerase sigma factor [Acidobacteriota bacterium]
MAASDQRLIAEALRGSEDAYRALVERYQRPVLGLVLRIVRERGLAEDLAQETFVKAFGALATFQVERKFSSWLFKIAHNAAIDALRRRRLDTLPLETADADRPDLLDFLPGPATDSPATALEARDLGAALAAAIAALKPEHRSAVELRFVQGLAYEEIADVLDLPLGTVKTHLHRARKKLMETLSAGGWQPAGG